MYVPTAAITMATNMPNRITPPRRVAAVRAGCGMWSGAMDMENLPARRARDPGQRNGQCCSHIDEAGRHPHDQTCKLLVEQWVGAIGVRQRSLRRNHRLSGVGLLL